MGKWRIKKNAKSEMSHEKEVDKNEEGAQCGRLEERGREALKTA